jgi:ATP-dependent Clp protease protease subunit
MKSAYNKSASASSPQYISPEALKYYNAMKKAAAEGGDLADYIDPAGMDALRKITAYAKNVNTGLDGTVSDEVGGAIRSIPSVIDNDPVTGRQGYDLFSLMLKQRVVLIEGPVDDTMAQIVCASLLFLGSGNDAEKPITMQINSPGGSVLAGLAIYDTMRFIDAPITTVGMGMQASMGSILLAAGDYRKMTKNSWLMIHQVSSGNSGQHSDTAIDENLTSRLHEQLKNIYVRHIGLTHEFWDLALERNTWLTAEQALKMGFIHEIAEDKNPKKTTAYEKESIRDEFRKAREDQVPKSADGILKLLNNASARGGEAAKIRPELVTALSQFPQFWTEGKKKEKAAHVKASNDNAATSPAKKTGSGPAP